ncbi:MAG TPA: hypothetical protein VFC28_10765, partial [Opitutaceae bacterium]|nr:hypothetical protein [Opitutaceae bacterium]
SMSTSSDPSAPESGQGSSRHPFAADQDQFEGIDLREIFARLIKGLAPTIGLALLGLVVAAVAYLIVGPYTTATTSMRVVFAFSGFEKGEYPDHSKFQPDDMRAPDLVIEALKREGLNVDEETQSKIRAAITVEGIIPADVVKARDRLRATGQNPPAYQPDEYLLTLTLPRGFSLSNRQRGLLLNDLVDAYRQKFQRTYADVPKALGNVFETLHDADYFEYELVFTEELQNVTAFLTQQLEQAKMFRSSTTNLSFSDLLKETDLFTKIRLNETMGLIRLNGLSRDRTTAMVKMDYYLRILEDQEQKSLEEQKVIQDLLTKAQQRSQDYVLGIKSQATQQRPESPVLDQGLIDSLLANDAYSFLVHKALDAGMAVTAIQSEKAQLLERRKIMEGFLKSTDTKQSTASAQVDKSLNALGIAYNDMISNIRNTYTDFARQQFADTIRITMSPITGSKYRPLAIAGIIGAFLGLAAGTGLSLLGIYIGEGKKA